MKSKFRTITAFKNVFFIHSVVCGTCQRTRYWDDEKDFNPDTCPECASKDITFSTVEVVEYA